MNEELKKLNAKLRDEGDESAKVFLFSLTMHPTISNLQTLLSVMPDQEHHDQLLDLLLKSHSVGYHQGALVGKGVDLQAATDAMEEVQNEQ